MHTQDNLRIVYLCVKLGDCRRLTEHVSKTCGCFSLCRLQRIASPSKVIETGNAIKPIAVVMHKRKIEGNVCGYNEEPNLERYLAYWISMGPTQCRCSRPAWKVLVGADKS